MDQPLYSNRIDRLYYSWICELAFPDPAMQAQYSNLLDFLNAIPFIPVLDMDDNRRVDGIDLRSHFGYKAKIPTDIINEEFRDKPCSVLEMMVALANRCDEEIMYDFDKGDRTNIWFYDMLVSLGIQDTTNDKWNIFTSDYVFSTIENFMRREFSPNGVGGLFVINNPKQDLRSVDFWTQMCWYANQKTNSMM